MMFFKKMTTRSALWLCVMALALPSLGMQPATAEKQALSLVTTVFPAYDFAHEVTGGQADIKLLLPPGGDSHSYEPTPQDIIAIQNADLFIYTGGESDEWITRILSSMGEDAPPALAMLDCVVGLAEAAAPSMDDHEHHDHEAEGEHVKMLDEHVWTSPRNAMLIVDALRDKLSQLAPGDAADFERNAAVYQEKLLALDEEFTQVVESGQRKLIVFGDRFPFQYFAQAYGLTYDAAFPGCSEDSEPSVKTIISLTETIRANQIPVVFYIEFSSRKTADILCEETGAKALLFHSYHTVSAQEMADGASYLSLMTQNVAALREALN